MDYIHEVKNTILTVEKNRLDLVLPYLSSLSLQIRLLEEVIKKCTAYTKSVQKKSTDKRCLLTSDLRSCR